MEIAITYWFILSIMGYLSMYVDKKRAKKGVYRIPEKTLFIIAFLGGSIGSILGMYQFRHKTKHRSFLWGMPAILAFQIACIFGILKILF